MSRLDTGIVHVTPDLPMEIFDTDESMEHMESYRSLMRFKFVHEMSSEELKTKFRPGTCLIRPGDAVAAITGEEGSDTLHFTPLYFYPEFCKWSDRKDKESPMIVERSFDPDSELARRANTKKLRFETYPGEEESPKPKQYRYVHHLRFPGYIVGDHPNTGMLVVLSFEKGEYINGENFIAASKMRTIKVQDPEDESAVITRRAPLWMQVWKLTAAKHYNDEGSWYGFDFDSPDPKIIASTTPQDKIAEYSIVAKQLAKDHHDSILRVEEDREPADEAEVKATVEF